MNDPKIGEAVEQPHFYRDADLSTCRQLEGSNWRGLRHYGQSGSGYVQPYESITFTVELWERSKAFESNMPLSEKGGCLSTLADD